MTNQANNFWVIIPARYASSRFPGKPLVDIDGKPMLQHTYERAMESGAGKVLIATDDQRIKEVAEQFGADVYMTSDKHQSGTDRIVEVVEQLRAAPEQIIVNVQGDEPFIPPENIRQVADNLVIDQQASMATLSTPLGFVEAQDTNIVKVVTNQYGHALYFSRSLIPFYRDQKPSESIQFQRHIGIYAYRMAYLQRYAIQAMSLIEQVEKLEQLRALWYGEVIHVDHAVKPPPIGIDTPEDLLAYLS